MMTVQECFEAWYSEKYAFEMKRGVGGRVGKSLRKHEGEYVSDHAREAYEIWCIAVASSEMMK